ncbi:MAG: hypothetical protein ACPLZA_06390 [Thermodesulfovibrio sp.]|uniref:HEPN domain-containing protein n=1 Tax=Thermodesulfovibrio obliviosus TaxID=3118332 RepID=A0AAU8H0N8_9BACT
MNYDNSSARKRIYEKSYFTRADALKAIEGARKVVEVAKKVIKP